jgi:hypothetical protein
MLIFRDEILKQCSAGELASLLTIAQTHNVEAVTDEVSQNQEAIKAYIQRRAKEEAEEENYTERLEAGFM